MITKELIIILHKYEEGHVDVYTAIQAVVLWLSRTTRDWLDNKREVIH